MSPEEKIEYLKYYMLNFIELKVANETVAKFSPHKIISFEDFIKPENQITRCYVGEGWNNRRSVKGVHGFEFSLDYANKEWEVENVGYLKYAIMNNLKIN